MLPTLVVDINDFISKHSEFINYPGFPSRIVNYKCGVYFDSNNVPFEIIIYSPVNTSEYNFYNVNSIRNSDNKSGRFKGLVWGFFNIKNYVSYISFNLPTDLSLELDISKIIKSFMATDLTFSNRPLLLLYHNFTTWRKVMESLDIRNVYTFNSVKSNLFQFKDFDDVEMFYLTDTFGGRFPFEELVNAKLATSGIPDDKLRYLLLRDHSHIKIDEKRKSIELEVEFSRPHGLNWEYFYTYEIRIFIDNFKDLKVDIKQTGQWSEKL